MVTEYAKDAATGIVSQNSDGEIILTGTRPAADSPELASWSKGRGHSGRVFIPDGEVFTVQVVAKGKVHIIASGTTYASTSNKLCPILVRVRLEEEALEPEAPEEEVG